MSSSRRNSKQISAEEEHAAAQAVKSPETAKLKIKLKQPEQPGLTENEVKELFVAIEKNNGKIVKHFLTAKNVLPDTLFESDIFEDGPFTWSALHAAAYYGSSKVIDILMEHNANVELQDTWYKGRPLAWAAFGGHLETAQLLIERYGADKKATNDHGQVALELVYELTPKWSKMFAETNSNKASKSVKLKSDKDLKSHHKDSKSSKDTKDGKTAGTSSPSNPYSSAFTELYQLVLHHKDKNGREIANIFLALPSKSEYPEYYDVIKSPMSLALVLSRIKTGHYKTIEDFDREFQLIFENALIFNEDGSRINKDARMLLKLFNTKKKEVFAAHKLIFNPVVTQEKNRTVVSSHTDGHHLSYQAGEFVQLRDENRTILFIERLERDPRGNRFVIGSKFLRPNEIFQVPGQTFYENEVLKATGEHDYDFSLVDHKVYVQALKDFVKGAVMGFEPKDVYVLESRYSEAHKSAYVIKDWKRVYSIEPLAMAVRPYPSPVKPQRVQIPSKVSGEAVSAGINSHGRRASSATQSDSSKRNRQSRPKKSKSRRKGGEDDEDDDDDDDDDEDDEEDSDVDVDGMASPTQQQGRRSSHLQRHPQNQQIVPPQQQFSHQQHQMHQQQQQQQPLQHFPQNGMQQQPFPFGHPQHQQHQHHPPQDHSRRISSQFSTPGMMSNPNMMHPQQQQQQQMLMQQQQPQHPHMYLQQQQPMQFQQMQPHLPPHHQQQQQQPMLPPQSPGSAQSQSMGSPGSPGMMGVDPRTGMVVPAFPPQPFVPADIATIYDPSVGPKEGYAMLQSLKVDADDKSFAMNLSTLTFAHSFVVQQHVTSVSLIPLLAQQLSPIQQQVGLSVFHNGRKIMPSGLVSLPVSPTVGHHVYTINLIQGQNTVDVWVSAPVGGIFQGGQPGGKSETQQFFVFIQRNNS